MGVICACLPTLGPLFHGETAMLRLFHSVKGYVRMRKQDRRTSTLKHDAGLGASKPFSNSSREYYGEVPNEAFILTTIQEGR